MKHFLRLMLGLLSPAVFAATLSREDLSRAIAPYLAADAVRAVSVGVVQGQEVATAHAGTLSGDVDRPPDERTLYEIGSVTKVFTALLLAEAVVRDEVELDTPVARLLPEDVVLPEGAGEKITLRMLATHTSGLPRVPPEIPQDDYRDPYAAYGEAALWATLRQVKLDFPPGTRASYSNLAVGLLGTLLARRADRTYAALLSERITEPLGLKDTVLTLSPEQRERLAPPHNGAGQRWTSWGCQALAGAGGIRSTLADLLRFARAMLQPEGTPLQRAIELGWAKQDLSATLAPGGQALGWFLAGDGSTRWHNGVTGGYHAAIFVHRPLGLASVVLANRSTPAGSELAEVLMRRAAGLPERAVPNATRPTVALTAAQLDRCTGTFRINPSFALVIERRNDALFVSPTGQATDRLYAAAPDAFFSRRVAADLVFELPDGTGPATALTLHQSGRSIRAVREP